MTRGLRCAPHAQSNFRELLGVHADDRQDVVPNQDLRAGSAGEQVQRVVGRGAGLAVQTAIVRSALGPQTRG